MITKQQIQAVLKTYDLEHLTIGVLGGHSALDICAGMKKMGFRTLVICQKGREQTYTKYFKKRGEKGCVDEVLVLDKFADIIKEEVQEKLRAMNTIIVQSRYFWVYTNYDEIEKNFNVPILGNRGLLRLEDRSLEYHQMHLLDDAGIRRPRVFKTPAEIDRLVLIKCNEATRAYERAFFFATTPEEYEKQAEILIKNGTIKKDDLEKALIEEYVLGAQVNFNYFVSPLTGELELMGTDTRRQTNMEGLLRLPATEQIEVLKHISPSFVETGHYTVTTKESLLEKIYVLGEKLVTATNKKFAPGLIGPFALQGAVVAEKGREDIVIFDVSFRMPGSPGIMFTPYTTYLYGRSVGYGERLGLELKEALRLGQVEKLVT